MSENDEEEMTLAQEMRAVADGWDDPHRGMTIYGKTSADIARQWADELDERYVALPCDAKGEPWHVGDRCVAHDRLTCARWHGKIIELQLCENGEFVARVLPDKKAEGMRFRMSELSRPCAPADRLRSWVAGARNDEHMDLRVLDAIADELEAGR